MVDAASIGGLGFTMGLVATGGFGRGGTLEASEVLEPAAADTSLGEELLLFLSGELKDAFSGRFETGGEAVVVEGAPPTAATLCVGEFSALFPEAFFDSLLSPLDGRATLPLTLPVNCLCWRAENTSLLRSLTCESRERDVRSLVDPPPSDANFSWPEVSMSDVSLERGAVEKSESNRLADQ